MQKFSLLLIILMATPASAEEEKEAPAMAESTDPDSFTPTDSYVHAWIKLPEVSGQSVRDSSTASIKSQPGQVTVIVFLASYDEPSQQLILDFMRLERKYASLHANFHYVFSHDTRDDALGFMEEFQIRDGILSNHTILKEYHNPDLPTIYIGDRHGWLTKRFVGVGESQIADLEVFLKHATAF